MQEPIKIFIAYAHEDAEYLEKLHTHLMPLIRSGRVQIWTDGKIEAGIIWEDAITENLHHADIILLLVSADAFASDYFYEKEMKEALERHEKGEACVVPMIIKPCLWQNTPLGTLQALPEDGLPVSHWTNIDDAYINAVKSLLEIIDNLEAKREKLAREERLRLDREEQIAIQKEIEKQQQLERNRLDKKARKAEQKKLADAERIRRAKEEQTAKQKAAAEQEQLERNRLAEKARKAKQAKKEGLWKLPIKLKQKLVDFIDNAPSRTKKYGLFAGLGIGIIAVTYAINNIVGEEPPKVCTEHVHTFPSDDGKVGLMRCNDTLSATYDAIGNFSEGLAVVEKDSLFGFIDTTGNVVIQIKYKEAGAFSNGKALVKLNEDKFYIDKNGDCIKDCPKTEDEIWHIQDSISTLDSYHAYLHKYPNGKYVEDAKKKIVQIMGSIEAAIKYKQWIADAAANYIKGDSLYISKAYDEARKYYIIVDSLYRNATGLVHDDSIARLGVEKIAKRLSETDDEIAWKKAKRLNTIEAYKEYKKNYPNGRYIQQAKDELAWLQARDRNTIEAYQEYLKAYPKGKYVEYANKSIEYLKLIPIPDLPGKTSPIPTPPPPPPPPIKMEVRLAGITWLAQNLNVQTKNSWCFEEKDENCDKYGRLYTWKAANQACRDLGAGWRLPSVREWEILIGTHSSNSLLSGGTSGFNALLGGKRIQGKRNSEFLGSGEDSGEYWSEMVVNDNNSAWSYYFKKGQNITRIKNNINNALSCRCVKD